MYEIANMLYSLRMRIWYGVYGYLCMCMYRKYGIHVMERPRGKSNLLAFTVTVLCTYPLEEVEKICLYEPLLIMYAWSRGNCMGLARLELPILRPAVLFIFIFMWTRRMWEARTWGGRMWIGWDEMKGEGEMRGNKMRWGKKKPMIWIDGTRKIRWRWTDRGDDDDDPIQIVCFSSSLYLYLSSYYYYYYITLRLFRRWWSIPL